MSGIERASYKGGFKRRQLKSYTRRFIAIVGISFGLLGGSLRAEFLHVASSPEINSGNTVSAYRIGENGVLTAVAGSPFPASNAPDSAAVDLLGRFVYVANGDGTVSAYRIGENGALKPVAGSPFLAGAINTCNPDSVAVDLLGRFVYVTNGGGNKILAYRIGADGALTPVVGSPFPSGGISVAVDPLGRFVYVASPFTAVGAVSAYHLSPDGALESVAGSPFPGGRYPDSIAVDLLGRFVYVTNKNDNNISAYQIGKNGTLTPFGQFPTGSGPASVAVSP
jgi:6-phosphogluconolactonase